MEDLNNIWNIDDELNEEQLMNYVKGNLTEQEANAIERKMTDSSFINDGVEGLQQFSSAEKINAYTQQLNEKLHERLINKKRKNKTGFKGLSWEVIAIIVIILLCILGFGIVELLWK